MSDQPSPLPLSEAETRAFRELGLTPGHWAALAPVPFLLRTEFRRPFPAEIDLLLKPLAAQVPSLSPEKPDEAPGFWSRCTHGMSAHTPLALLGWHLAHRVERNQREEYLASLDHTAHKLLRGAPGSPQVPVSYWIREAIEVSLGHAEFSLHLTPVRLPPPNGAVAEKLFDPAAPQGLEGDTGLRLIARGLANRTYLEREKLLGWLETWVGKCVPTVEQLPRKCVDQVRKLVEEIIGAAKAPAPHAVESFTPAEPAEPTEPTEKADMPASPPELVTPPKALPAASPLPPKRRTPEIQTPTDIKALSFDEAVARARETSVEQIQNWLDSHEKGKGFLFDDCRSDDSGEIAVVSEPELVPRALWVVGDVHADVLSLANIIAYAESMTAQVGEPAFVFLGDFVDRGRHDHETLLLLFGLVMRDPSRVCIIPGNHDIDLHWGPKAGRFGVTIQPAEYCERLNTLVDSEDPRAMEQVQLAKLTIEFWKTRPKAVFLPDGTMFSHGGFPHTDVHDSLHTRADLCSKKCLDDFLWARLSESMKKRPNRGNRGHEFGWKDFAQFCQVMTERVRIPVMRLIRGHDHVPERWRLPSEYAEHPVLTINAMGWRMDGEPEPADGPHPFPVVARHVPGELPIITRLRIPPAEVGRAFRKDHPRAILEVTPTESSTPVGEILPLVDAAPEPNPEPVEAPPDEVIALHLPREETPVKIEELSPAPPEALRPSETPPPAESVSDETNQFLDDYGGPAIEQQQPPPRTEQVRESDLGNDV